MCTRSNMILCWNIYLFPKYNYDQDRRWSKPLILKWPTSCKTMNLSSEQNIKCGIHKSKHSNCKILSKKFLGPSTAPVPSVRTVAVILRCLVEPPILYQSPDIKELKIHSFYMFLVELRRLISLFTPSRPDGVAR